MPGGYRRYTALAPGSWFKTTTAREYLDLYTHILAQLDPAQVAAELQELAGPGRIPVMLCFESPAKIASAATWCHRHIAAQWFEDRLGIAVEEADHRGLDRWAFLRAAGIPSPAFR